MAKIDSLDLLELRRHQCCDLSLMKPIRCVLNMSYTCSMLVGLRRPPGRHFQTSSIHSFMPFSSIQPFSWTCTKIWGGMLRLGIVFLLKMIIGFNFVPSARQAKTTVKWFFSFPVVFIMMVLSPDGWTVLAVGMSKIVGVSSMLPICDIA